MRQRARRASPYALAALLTATGLVHFISPGSYDGLIPPFLPNPRAWIYGSGIAELACAAAVAIPATRRGGGLASAVLFVAVFPGNLYMAIEPGDVPRWAALARLPLQIPLVLWALQVARRTVRAPGRRGSSGRSRSAG
ncbi:MAG: hypothetical protein KY440_02840 [Actinobacteria bacterium]|nr:hypothetical protein [Actinomycetota bacterium]